MSEEVTISQMNVAETGEVLEFLARMFPNDPRQADELFWSWHFPDSPYCDADDLPIWLARVGGRIAGQLASVPVKLHVGGRPVSAIWILDLIVDPEFRRRGIAKKLALASVAYCPYVLGVNTPSQHSTSLLADLGWSIFTKIPRYHKVLFPGELVPEISAVRPVRNAANLIFAPLRRKRRGLNTVSVVEGFTDAFDELWETAKTQWQCSVSRDQAMLDWQFVRQPGKKFDILSLFDGDRLCGYAVMFFRRPNRYGALTKAAISDIAYGPELPEQTIDSLLTAAIELAIERRAGSVVTDVIDPLLESRLRKNGFARVRSDLQLLANVPQGDRKIVYNAGNWFLTRGDSDISIFEEPNL